MRTALVLAVLAAAAPALAQDGRGEAKLTHAGKTVSIEYGRPVLKGRDMLGRAKVGEQWRLGANAATTLETTGDLAFGTVKVPKGSYVLKATRTGEDAWTLNVLKKEATGAGALTADVSLAMGTGEAAEAFTIDLKKEKDGALLELRWGTTALRAPFTIH